MMKLPYFIINGNTNCNFDQLSKANDFCTEHNIPLIMRFTNFKLRGPDHFYLYQLQVFYNIIDNQLQSLHFIEKLKYDLYELHKLRVPRISTIAISIKAKNVIFEQNDEQENQEQTNQEEEEEEEEDIDDLPIKINEQPTTIKDRLKELPTNETAEQFWNSEKLFKDINFEKGILLSNKQKSDDDAKSIEKWNKTLGIQQERTIDFEYLKSKRFFLIPKDKMHFYRLFYYNEESKKWIIDSEQLKNLLIKGPCVCYLDSNEDDLILLNTVFTNGSFPMLDDDKEIFVYAILGTISKYSYSSSDSLFFFVHVPKEKKNLPNIKTIIIQIYAYLAYICDVRIVILNKNYYESQVQNRDVRKFK